MKKPDLLMALIVLVALGSAITGIASENIPASTALISEATIR